MNDKDPDFRQTGDSQTRILPQTLCQTLFILASLLILLAGPLYAVPSQSPAQAAPIQEQTEAPGQVIYQTRHRLKDSLGNSWQVIFYKRVAESDETRNLNLRLAGFPGAVEFQHPQPLILTPSRGDKLEAADDFAEEAPAPNIGEYDMGAIANRLPSRGSLELTLPLKERPASLQIPLPVILEWQDIVKK
ncbi:DUF3122 domain-containing protein [Phormidium yuhuli AB48]|uniref:DUF3122 domain-containing protein n=1 Tax=Phormidium yuhuli AB48 TaxID=2940671 RepID=A0ABY5ALS1_9CYAN|nr:DUF3122 domain-containing protein [Phormidium yuhuli]USR89960.1 DUF3122 domain-containing protein [Phormidium yuhuli AB48]